jgi:twitching motility protein PilT
MVPNSAIRNLIREDKIHQIYSQMQIGQSKFGMQTLNQSLLGLFVKGLITLEEALGRTGDADELKTMIANAQAQGNRPGGGRQSARG